MTTTPQQIAAISAQLSVDLATVTDDRIIELCLLYRSEPDAYPVFADNLKIEITRRFTAAEIAANDVMFSVIQNFSNQFTSPIPYFAKKMLEMAASVNRDIWFTNNTEFFTTAMSNAESVSWAISNPDVITKILANTLIALPIVAKSTVAATAILTDSVALTIFKDTPNIWEVWAQHSAGMEVIVKSTELSDYITNSPSIMAKVLSATSNIVIFKNNPIALQILINKEVSNSLLILNELWIKSFLSESKTVSVIVKSSKMLGKISKNTFARGEMIKNNTLFQLFRQDIYNTIKQNAWALGGKAGLGTMTGGTYGSNVTQVTANPEGIVFVTLGTHGSTPTSQTAVYHAPAYGGVLAVSMVGRNRDPNPTQLIDIDAVSFGGATYYSVSNYGSVFAEIYTAPL